MKALRHRRRPEAFASPAAAAVLLPVALLLAGCFYSFTGSSVPPHLKTVVITLFDDQTGSAEPSLREQFTNRLIERFRQDNSLEVTDVPTADCALEGALSTFSDQPTVVTAGETVQKARITIGVRALFRDQKLKKTVFEKTFTGWGEYDIGADPGIRNEALTTALDKVTEDILLETVSGW
jgi:hypothetical protein